MIETYAIAAGALIAVGAFLGVLVIRALGARSQRAPSVAVSHFDRVAVGSRTVRSADVVIISRSPRAAITREPQPTLARHTAAQPQLTLAGRAATTGSWR